MCHIYYFRWFLFPVVSWLCCANFKLGKECNNTNLDMISRSKNLQYKGARFNETFDFLECSLLVFWWVAGWLNYQIQFLKAARKFDLSNVKEILPRLHIFYIYMNFLAILHFSRSFCSVSKDSFSNYFCLLFLVCRACIYRLLYICTKF